MKFQIISSVLIVFLLVSAPDSISAELVLFTNGKVYSPEYPLQIYGKGLPEENLIIRLFAPDESIANYWNNFPPQF